MMSYRLDANACIGLLNRTSQSLWARTRRHAASEIGLPALVAHEQKILALDPPAERS